MASGRLGNNVLCPECGKQVEMLNGDVQFSMELHLQSHKPIEALNREIDEQIRNMCFQPTNMKKCNVPKEDVIVSNDDVICSNEMQVLEHELGNVQIQSDNQTTPTNRKSRKRSKNSQPNLDFKTGPGYLLEDMLSSMAPELKPHGGFISEAEKGEIVCNVCKMKVEPLTSLYEHLKTKLHEDKTIKFFTNILPEELHYMMDFVTFNGSNMCCNLCSFNFNLCSNNPKETMFSIMVHNLSQEHLEKKKSSESKCSSGYASVIIKSLAQLNTIIDENQHFLDFKMQPMFKCMLCNVQVGCNLNEKELYKSFTQHFISKSHLNSKAASELKSFKMLNIISKQTHSFVVSKGRINCTICKCSIEPNFHELTSHIKQSTPGEKLLNSISPMNSQQSTTLPVSSGEHSQTKECFNSLPDFFLKNSEERTQLKQVNSKCIVNIQGKSATEIASCSSNINKSHLLESGPSNNVEQDLQSCEIKRKSSESKDNVKMLQSLKQVPVSPHDEIKVIKTESEKLQHCLNDCDETIKNCIKYWLEENNCYVCTLCNIKVYKSNNEEYVKGTILSHMMGKSHVKKIGNVYKILLKKISTSDIVVKTNEQYLEIREGKIYCTLCLTDIPAPTDESSFKIKILSHLRRTVHNNNASGFDQSSSSSWTPIKDPIEELFISLPGKFKDDIAYIKAFSLDGFLSCLLCNKVITSQSLKDHLEDVSHIQKKAPKRDSPSYQNKTESKTTVKNIGTLTSLLGNIDKKLLGQLVNEEH